MGATILVNFTVSLFSTEFYCYLAPPFVRFELVLTHFFVLHQQIYISQREEPIDSNASVRKKLEVASVCQYEHAHVALGKVEELLANVAGCSKTKEYESLNNANKLCM